jgi:arsenate reductase-like glutaredoxin family protein
MKTLKTISNQVIKISANKSARTYTIRTNGSKYRTTKMSKEEFNSNSNNTGNDWKNFLSTSDYSLIK